jgi:regulator of protease activity HflC (stomatin/prohibitin superfamily)
MNKKVYVANLPSQVGEPELKALFSKSESVMSVKIVKDRQTDQPRGIAFVEMSTQWEARRAVSMLNHIDPAFNDFVKEVVPTYPIGEILPKREEIRQRAMKKLGDNLSRYHIIVDDIYFANIRFSPEYEGAIEAKQVAQQQVETQKQVLAQREIEAQQKVATAKGEAESILVVAQGQAKANDALSRSISPILVQYKSIEKWSGILPQVSGGAVPFIDLGKMGGSSGGTDGGKK